MVDITTTVNVITEMARGRMEAIPIKKIVGQPSLDSVRHLVDQLATFASHFATTKWVGKHEFLPLVLSKAKMRLAAGDNSLDCKWVDNTDILNPRIKEATKG